MSTGAPSRLIAPDGRIWIPTNCGPTCVRPTPECWSPFLAQLTGDPAVVDRFAPKISHVPDPPEQAGVTDPETAAALVEAVVAALQSPRSATAVPADDLDLFARIAPVALGGTVGDEYLPLLLEQGGFQRSQPVLPRTAKLPDGFRVAIIGAGIAGLTAALELADAGIDYQIFDRNDEVGGTWYTTTYPGIGVDTPSAYYSLSRDINGDWSSYYPHGRGVPGLSGVGGR